MLDVSVDSLDVVPQGIVFLQRCVLTFWRYNAMICWRDGNQRDQDGNANEFMKDFQMKIRYIHIPRHGQRIIFCLTRITPVTNLVEMYRSSYINNV